MVALEIADVKTLIKNLRLSFATSTSCLAEMMQNARRSGASEIRFNLTNDTLLVCDDGCGIDDMQNLFSLTKSGWDNDVAAEDKPFGMGFLSCLFASSEVTIHSHNDIMNFKTADAIDFSSMEVKKVPEYRKGASFEMKGFSLPNDNNDLENVIGLAIQDYARGFGIKVFFNDDEMGRSHALDSIISFTESDGTHFSLAGADGANSESFGLGLVVYLQGLPVYEDNFRFGSKTIVHLNSRKHDAVMPDRNRLHDEKIIVKALREDIVRIWGEFFDTLIAEGKGDLIAQKYFAAIEYTDRMDILNQIDIIPRQLTHDVEYDPIIHSDDISLHEETNNFISRAELESDKVILVEFGDMGDITAAPWIFVHKVDNAFFLKTDKLHPDHWALKKVIHVSSMSPYNDDSPPNWTVVANGADEPTHFTGVETDFLVYLCDSYTIKVEDYALTVSHLSMGFGQCHNSDVVAFVVDEDKSGSSVLSQLSAYDDSYGVVDNSKADIDAKAFKRHIQMHRNKDPGRFLMEIINDSGVQKMPPLFGDYKLSISDGQVSVSLI